MLYKKMSEIELKERTKELCREFFRQFEQDSMLFADMSKQEFLDRESVWSLVFFLDNGLRWLDTRIVINDWVVRLNHTEM